jgi:hypothetical protein
VKAIKDEDVVSGPDQDLVKENDRLRREIRILKEEREVLKRQPSSLRDKSHEVRFLQPVSWSLSCDRLCRLMEVTDRGLRYLVLNVDGKTKSAELLHETGLLNFCSSKQIQTKPQPRNVG